MSKSKDQIKFKLSSDLKIILGDKFNPRDFFFWINSPNSKYLEMSPLEFIFLGEDNTYKEENYNKVLEDIKGDGKI